MRLNYDRATLDESQLAATPLQQFERWLHDAVAEPAIVEPNAMVLGTLGEVPSARTVLLKGIDARGLTFYTNYGSRKAQQMAQHPDVTALFPWYPLHRQVIVTGTVTQVSREESAEYFATRPHKSQLGAHASAQSTPIADRAPLEAAMAAQAGGLDRAAEDQAVEARGRAGDERTDDEDRERREEAAAHPETVGEPSGERHRDDRDEQVAAHDPGGAPELRPGGEVGEDRRERDGGDHQLEAREEDAGPEDREEHEPLTPSHPVSVRVDTIRTHP